MKREMIVLIVTITVLGILFSFGSCKKEEIEKEQNKIGEIDYNDSLDVIVDDTIKIDTTTTTIKDTIVNIDTIIKDSIIIENTKINKILLKNTEKDYVDIDSPFVYLYQIKSQSYPLMYNVIISQCYPHNNSPELNFLDIRYDIIKNELKISTMINTQCPEYCTLSFVFDDGSKFNYNYNKIEASYPFPIALISQENINKFKTNKLVKVGYNIKGSTWISYYNIEPVFQNVVKQYLWELANNYGYDI